MNTDVIERIIGYKFKDVRLLVTAFTHSSYANEHAAEANEQFEFLGDGLLGFIVAEKLFHSRLSEGEMTVMRALLVSTPPLCRVMENCGLSGFIRFGQGEAGKDHAGKKVLADAFESLVAAVYLDGGMDNARQLVLKLLAEEITAVLIGKKETVNYKGELQELVQKHKLGGIEYVQKSSTGSDHEPEFVVVVCVDGAALGEGCGKKLKDAEQLAAKAALKIINTK